MFTNGGALLLLQLSKTMKTMKAILSLFFLLVVGSVASAQTFYVEKTLEGYEQPIIEKLLALNKKTTTEPKTSDYTIICIITERGGPHKRARGYVKILDTKTGNMLARSEESKGVSSAFNGMENPRLNLMERQAKNYLENLLSELKK